MPVHYWPEPNPVTLPQAFLVTALFLIHDYSPETVAHLQYWNVVMEPFQHRIYAVTTTMAAHGDKENSEVQDKHLSKKSSELIGASCSATPTPATPTKKQSLGPKNTSLKKKAVSYTYEIKNGWIQRSFQRGAIYMSKLYKGMSPSCMT